MDIAIADKTTLDKVANAVGVGEHKIYGIKISKSNGTPSTRCEYLADAKGMTPAKMNFDTGVFNYGDWANIWFVKENFPCILNADGTVAYKLSKTDHTKKEDGITASDVANTDNSFTGNAMSAMPLVWIYQYEDASYKYIFLSDSKINDNYKAFAHTDASGNVHNYVYLSMYNGVQTTNGNTLRSLSGIQPMHSKTAENEIAYAKLNGTGWFTKTWSQRNLLQCLMTMMFCSTNSQEYLGKGNLNYINDSGQNYGKLVTGTLNDKGQFWGANDNTHQVKAFYIEGVWANIWDRIAGLVNDNGTIRAKMTPSYPESGLTASATFAGYDVVCSESPQGTSGGYINETQMSEFGDIPYKASGSDSTFECDGLWFNNGQLNYALVGGNCRNGSLCGLFSLYLAGAASYASWYFGASLSYL